jgi:uncharacterized protein (TIGR02996 family)
MKTSPLAKSLLGAILASPNDDTPRLVYADWLEEQGDAARAEFIRVQCEKARLPKWDRRWPLLAWRERVLLTCHGHLWRAELPPIDDVQWGTFTRGFVDEVQVGPAGTLLTSAAAICAAAPVRSAFVQQWDVGEDCGPLPFLRKLGILSSYMDEGMDEFFQSPLLSTLTELDLSGLNMEGEQFAALARSPHLMNLTALYLDDCYMGDGNLRPFLETGRFGNLTTLSMKGNQGGYHEDARIRPDDVALLADSPSLSRLRSLNLAHNEIDVLSLRRLLASPRLAHLQELDVSRNRLSAQGVDNLGGIDTAMRLRSLTLSHNPIGDEGAAALARSSWTSTPVN